MNKLKYLIIIILFLGNSCKVFQNNSLRQIEEKIESGDKNGLVEILPYLNSQKSIKENIGYHQIIRSEANIAKKILIDNCFFLDSEINLMDSVHIDQYENFIQSNFSNIYFDTLTNSFLLTPWESREYKIKFRKLTTYKKEQLEGRCKFISQSEWVKEAKIDSLITAKDSKSLLILTSELLKRRNRGNTVMINHHTPYFIPYDCISLLQHLTGFEVGFENQHQQTEWNIYTSNNPEAQINQLIYFAKNYSKFSWDNKNSIFVNVENKIPPTAEKNRLFQLVSHHNDSIALDAFIQLTAYDSKKLSPRHRGSINSKSVPLFTYKTIWQLAKLTDYCEVHQIDFRGSPAFKSKFLQLDSDISFIERRKLEDEFIENMTLEEVTAFEYWALIYQRFDRITFSAGRILDIFYSYHWNEILNNQEHLKLYLTKAKLFSQIGIVGYCGKYLIKFTNQGGAAQEKIGQVKFTDQDEDISYQIRDAMYKCSQKLNYPKVIDKFSETNRDETINNPKGKLKQIKLMSDQRSRIDSLLALISKINYDQIGIILREIEDIQIYSQALKYSFLEKDWGFFMDNNFESLDYRNDFLDRYDQLNELELYTYYLDQAKIDYKNEDNTLNYNKIYHILKYNSTAAIAGGMDKTINNETYFVIKVLEITHNTSLGFPKKLCNSEGRHHCDTQSRSKEWRKFLTENNLLQEIDTEPVSFKYK